MTTPTKQPIWPYFFYAAGLLLAALAFLARVIGLDHDVRWGASRWALLAAGLVLIAIPLLARLWNSAAVPESLRRGLGGGARRIAPAIRRVAGIRALAILLAGLVALGLCAYALWYVTAGQFPKFPYVNNSYVDLGEAFLHGQSCLLIKPSQELMALPDPYDLQQRSQVPYNWDLTYYNGCYYLYWGPVPGLVSALFQAIGRARTADGLLLFGAYAGLALAVLGLLLDLWRHRYSRAPGLSLALLLLASLFNLPYLAMLGRPQVYETSILYGQLFLMLGLWFWVRYLFQEKNIWLVLAGLSWGLAVGCKQTTLISVGAYTLVALIYMIRRPRLVARAAALLAPLAACGAALLLYNYARFGNPLETGYNYQLSIPIYENRVFSPIFTPANLYAYLLYPLGFTQGFPFVSILQIDASKMPAWAIAPKGKLFDMQIFGLLAAVPLIWLLPLGLVSAVGTRGRPAAGRPLTSLVWMIVLGGLAQFALTVLFVSSAMRYMMDFWPSFTLMLAIAAWSVDERLQPVRWLRWLWWALVAALVAWGTVLAYFGAFDLPPQVFRATNRPAFDDIRNFWYRTTVAWQALVDSPGLVGAGLRLVMKALR